VTCGAARAGEIWINAVDCNPAEDLTRLLGKVGIAAGGDTTLGIETDTYGLTGRNHQLLLDALGASGHSPPRGRALKESSHIVRELRMIKSAAEIEKMRMANELCDRAIMAGFEAARPGVLDSVLLST
jgi:Xaa-Pro dipeptidase